MLKWTLGVVGDSHVILLPRDERLTKTGNARGDRVTWCSQLQTKSPGLGCLQMTSYVEREREYLKIIYATVLRRRLALYNLPFLDENFLGAQHDRSCAGASYSTYAHVHVDLHLTLPPKTARAGTWAHLHLSCRRE